ncbi:DUF4377 domain-containing protein [Paucihalobacter sp.]|uniref:DUF4377 domain-containing protein n=1 Tax=Paucihalobacter sp. TaxID=2850405 RepID=UPI002FE2CD35
MKLSCVTFCLLFLFLSCNKDVNETMYVSGKTINCPGVIEKECLQIKYSLEEDYINFYDDIEGFQHDKGTDYIIKIKRTEVNNPPADDSKYKYSLVEVLEKKPTPTALEDGSWLVVGIVGFKGDFKRDPLLSLSPDLNQVSGSTGCNRIFGKIITDKNKLSFQNIGTTKMACDDNGLETQMLTVLEKTVSYKITENVLLLEDGDGNVILKASNIDRKE